MALAERYVSALATGGGDGSIGNPWTLTEAFANVAVNTRVWVKRDGTYLLPPGGTTLNVTPTFSAPVVFTGYRNTPGDGYLGWDQNLRLITTNMPVLTGSSNNYNSLRGREYTVFENLFLDTSYPRDHIKMSSGAGLMLLRCAVKQNHASGESRCVNVNGLTAVECDFELAGFGVHSGIVSCPYYFFRLVCCRLTARNAIGAEFGVYSEDRAFIAGCIFDTVPSSNNNGAITTTYTRGRVFAVDRNTFYNCARCVAFNSSSTAGDSTNHGMLLTHNLVVDCGVFAKTMAAADSPIFARRNRMVNVATPFQGLFGDWPDISDNDIVSESPQSDLVDPANGDLRVRPGSPAAEFGATLSAFGVPPLSGVPNIFQPPFVRGPS